jgi:hypothetical protein
MSMKDNEKSIGNLDRQEILTYLMIFVFGGFAVIVGVVMYLILSNPELTDQIKISGMIDIGNFVNRFDELLIAFLVLLGVGVGAKVKSK